MPQAFPARPKYLQQFREMASAVIQVQGADGLWRYGVVKRYAHSADQAVARYSGDFRRRSFFDKFFLERFVSSGDSEDDIHQRA